MKARSGPETRARNWSKRWDAMAVFAPATTAPARRTKAGLSAGRADRMAGLMSHNPYSDPLDAAFSDPPETAPVPTSSLRGDPPYLNGLNKEQREAVESVD